MGVRDGAAGRRAGLAAVVAGTAVALVAVAGVVLPAAGGPAQGTAPPAAPSAGRGAAVVAAPAGTGSSADLSASAASLQERLARLPGDWTSWAALGSTYVELARTTADPTYYDRADDAFRRSLAVRPEDNAEALAGQGGLAAARHDFAGARALAERALALDPYDTTALGVLTDALVELGDVEGAEAVLQRMLDLRPGVPALARVSYLRELRGDVDGAREALEQALAQAVRPSDAAFALQYLGELALGQGDPAAAGARFEEGLRVDPASVPLLAGRARVQEAQGDRAAALATWAVVVRRLPQPSYLAAYGDLLAVAGRQEEAQRQYALVEATHRLLAAQGADVDLETALFDADHGRVEQALAAAQRERARRVSVHVEDAYGWALHRAGRSEEALVHVRAAARLGTRSALFAFHRGLVEAAVGDPGARASLELALRLDAASHPLLAREARTALRGPGAGE